jgi:hypothetical protein
VIESFGGAGYVEDTGLPMLLRDAQVLPIWEGTTNVLALDTLRAIDGVRGVELIEREARYVMQGVRQPDLVRFSARVEQTLEAARLWLTERAQEPAVLEAGARRFALTLGRAFALALLTKHAQWSVDHEQDNRPLAAARRFAGARINLLADHDAGDARLLARDVP